MPACEPSSPRLASALDLCAEETRRQSFSRTRDHRRPVSHTSLPDQVTGAEDHGLAANGYASDVLYNGHVWLRTTRTAPLPLMQSASSARIGL